MTIKFGNKRFRKSGSGDCLMLKESIMIAAPCPVSWDSMKGDDRARFCTGCSKTVYNLSDLSDAELETFLQDNGFNNCVRLFRRTDGKILTDNCPRALRPMRNKLRLIAQVAAGIIAAFFGLLQGVHAQGQGADNQQNKKKVKWVIPVLKEPYPGAWAAGGPMPRRFSVPADQPIPEGCIEVKGPESSIPAPTCPTAEQPKPPISVPQNGDLTAINMEHKAAESASKGKLLLAQAQYLKAIRIATKQTHSDPKYIATLYEKLNALRKKMGMPSLQQKETSK